MKTRQLRCFAAFSEVVHCIHMGCAITKTIVMTHTQVIFSIRGDRGSVAGVGSMGDKSGKSGISCGKGEGHVVFVMCMAPPSSSSAV